MTKFIKDIHGVYWNCKDIVTFEVQKFNPYYIVVGKFDLGAKSPIIICKNLNSKEEAERLLDYRMNELSQGSS